MLCFVVDSEQLHYFRDPPLPVQRFIQPMEAYKGDNSLAKQFEQSRVTLLIAAKMLEKMRGNQKRHYKNRKSVHTFKVGDLVLLRKHNKDKLKWEPNYRITRLPHLWSAVDNQFTGRTKRCNVSDLKIKHPGEDWDLKPATIGRAARFVNHLDNLPDVDSKPDQTEDTVKSPPNKYHLRQCIKPPTKLDL